MIAVGPKIRQFAELVGSTPDEVVEWMQTYVENPLPEQLPESTKAEREASIKRYVATRLESERVPVTCLPTSPEWI
jgi:hypothetical protein